MREIGRVVVTAVLVVGLLGAAGFGQSPRRVISLDGVWEIAQGTKERVPERFDARVPVPGLVDMAQPAFAEVGQKSSLREAFWYRRTFELAGPIPTVARLKVHKATFGTRVYVNGKLIGDHVASYTPGHFDVRGALKEGENEVIIRVGAFRDAVPATVPSGWDYEKTRFTPGIFDSVELILSGTPHILNVQVVPDVAQKAAGIQVWVQNNGAATSAKLEATIREAKSGKVVAQAQIDVGELAAGGTASPRVAISIPECRLWSPEDPFLYELTVSSQTDSFTTRFGVRSFSFDHATGRAMLNGKPYFLRGTNVTLYRFFEDPSRGDKPWREEWVRRLHKAFKTMRWNSARYCIGFPPEFWYRIADEEGILIQDEFPIWNMGPKPGDFDAGELAREYAEWMQERWNHPCVVIWDAQNESRTDETGKAIQMVRKLDLSGRPWDNGWSAAQDDGDCFESHPYLFSNASFRVSDLAHVKGVPTGNAGPNARKNAIIINEYCWLWINRDGTPTTLTKQLYTNLLGEGATAAQRRYTHARNVAALTEFWRCHRACAGVLHFCGLGYSRPTGQTCDDFLDIEKLNFEPEFFTYVREAFAPVGLMIDQWAEELPPGQAQQFPVVVINDLEQAWKGQVRMRLKRGEQVLAEKVEPCEVEGWGQSRLSFSLAVPSESGQYRVEAALVREGDEPVRSLRDFEVITAEQRRARLGLAIGRPVKASSVVTKDGQTYPAANAVDGRRDTRWSSEFSDPQWLSVDLGDAKAISRVELVWEAAYAKAYSIEVSLDGNEWKEVYRTASGKGGSEVIRFTPVSARWVRMTGRQRATPFGYSLWEMKVFP